MVEGVLWFNIYKSLESCGILHQFSCSGTPEQNDVLERKHRHIVETYLTLLFHANVSHYLLVDAFATAIFLTNRMPTPFLQNK